MTTRVGIIGTGWGARVQVPAFRAAGLEVVAIAGRDPQRTREIAAELSLQAHDDWRTVIESDVDLVTVVTPPSTHREMATAVLRAGKHLLSEKPTAMNAAEALEMLQVAKAHPQQLALIDHELRFLPTWIEARRRVSDLGGIRYVEFRYGSPGRGDRSREWNWWSDAAQGGGVLGAVASHAIDATRYLTGREVVAAQAQLHTFIASRPFESGDREVTSDDFAALNLRLEGDAIAAMSFSVVAAVEETTTLTIHGEKGGIRLSGEQLLTATRGASFNAISVPIDHPEGLAGNSNGGPFGTGTYYLAAALKRALESKDLSGLSPAATFDDGLAQQRALDAARESHRSGGQWIELPK